MSKMLIGSRAAKHWFPDFPRDCKDIDYIDESESTVGPDGRIDSKFCPSFKYLIEKYPEEIAPPIVLHSLKISHFEFDVHWSKTSYDLKFFQSKNVPYDEDLVNVLYKDCEQRYGKKRGYLEKRPDSDLFKDAVRRKYVHDDLHNLVKFYDEPMFIKIKEDKNNANTSWKLFENLNLDDKIKTIQEEAFVIALERFLIPENFSINPLVAYNRALKLLVTKLFKGRWSRFLATNWLVVSEKPSDNKWVQKVKNAIEMGELKEL